mgnify:CR=1 FL=1
MTELNYLYSIKQNVSGSQTAPSFISLKSKSLILTFDGISAVKETSKGRYTTGYYPSYFNPVFEQLIFDTIYLAKEISGGTLWNYYAESMFSILSRVDTLIISKGRGLAGIDKMMITTIVFIDCKIFEPIVYPESIKKIIRVNSTIG